MDSTSTDQPKNAIAELTETILTLTQAEWQTHQKALLLARLGGALVTRGFDLRTTLRGEKLASFIRTELANSVRLVQSPTDNLVWGVVPANALLGDDVSRYFSPPQDEKGQAARDRIRFDMRLWVAFCQPISDKLVRTVSLEPEIQFTDVEPEVAKQINALVVPRELVVAAADAPKWERDERIYNNVVTWMQANGIAANLVKFGRAGQLRLRLGESALHVLLDALDNSDLRRIEMPLDLVDKLLRHELKRDR